MTVAAADYTFGSIRLPGEAVWILPQYWWHPGGFELKKAAIAFVDGHSGYVGIVPGEENAAEYRTSP